MSNLPTRPLQRVPQHRQNNRFTDPSEDVIQKLLMINDTISKDQTDTAQAQVPAVPRFGQPQIIQVGDVTSSSSDSSDSDDSKSDDSDDPDKEGEIARKDSIKAAPTKTLANKIRKKLASIPGLGLADDSPHSQLVEHLSNMVAKLSIENTMLKEELRAAQKKTPLPAPDKTLGNQGQDPPVVAQNKEAPERSTVEQAEPGYKYYHMVLCYSDKQNYFEDVPRMFKDDSKSDHLRGLRGVEDMVAVLKKQPHLAFAVVHHYICSCTGGTDYYRMVGHKHGKLLADSQPAQEDEDLKHVVLGESAMDGLTAIAKAHPSRFEGWDIDRISRFSHEPHFVFYCHATTFLELVDCSDLNESDRINIKLPCNWFLDNCKHDWDEANALFARGKITAKHFSKLFRPGELVINRWGNSYNSGHVMFQCAKVTEYPWKTPDPDKALLTNMWVFNGLFSKMQLNLNFSPMFNSAGQKIDEDDGEVDITSVFLYPLRFAEQGVYESLVARGNRFWNSVKTKVVSYNEVVQGGQDDLGPQPENRFVVDYNMFERMHPQKKMFQKKTDDLGSEATNKAEPPSDEFLAQLPCEIHAFQLSAKTWRLIRVDGITDVTWNKDAFSRLVLPQTIKELVQAAVTAHGEHLSAAPDIIAGKGQGLLILLHGGPGTGKTLTAESIAEIQERPLYRVTCGDIGGSPSEVERYLKSVFDIGKAWGCVVLLDEADVFLEERNIRDQRQNAIVSVFLCLLEYYDGILILTTNRVGTFDEAFKSRINLALRYHKLNEEQRLEIWRNFIRMLAKTNERIDIADLERNVNKLAQVELNGRQIRNVITLARYLAKFRKQMLVYKHVQDAFATVVEFDEYLLNLRGSDDHWATESKLR